STGLSVPLTNVHGQPVCASGVYKRVLRLGPALGASHARRGRGSGKHLPEASFLRSVWPLLLLAFLLLPWPTSGAQGEGFDEYRAKAGFLAAFPNFIEWPPETF